MNSSNDTWHAMPNLRATAAAAFNIGVGPHANISTSLSATRSSDASHVAGEAREAAGDAPFVEQRHAGDHTIRHAGHQDGRGPRAERKRNLRTHQHQWLPPRARVFTQPLGEEHHRRDPDAAADQQRARTLAMRDEAVADRAERVDRFTDAARCERTEARADDLV
jgi:hypothetical protein